MYYLKQFKEVHMCMKSNLKSDAVLTSLDVPSKLHPRQPNMICNIDMAERVTENAYSELRNALAIADVTLGEFFEQYIDAETFLQHILPHCMRAITSVRRLSATAYRLLCDFWEAVEWGKIEAMNVDKIDSNDDVSYPLIKHPRQDDWKSLKFQRSVWIEYETKILGIVLWCKKLGATTSDQFTDDKIEEIENHLLWLKELGEDLYNYCIRLIIDVKLALHWANNEAVYHDTLVSK